MDKNFIGPSRRPHWSEGRNKYDFSFFYLPIQNNILAEGLPSAAQDFENILSVELGIVRSNFT